MTFCVASQKVNSSNAPALPANGRFLRVECACRFAAGPVWVRRDADAQADCAHEKDLQMQAFSEAADGIRTHDLLHGKQSVGFRVRADIACKLKLSPVWMFCCNSPAFHASSRGFRHPGGTRTAADTPGRHGIPIQGTSYGSAGSPASNAASASHRPIRVRVSPVVYCPWTVDQEPHPGAHTMSLLKHTVIVRSVMSEGSGPLPGRLSLR